MPLPILLLRKRKLRHSLGRPSRSDFVQLVLIEERLNVPAEYIIFGKKDEFDELWLKSQMLSDKDKLRFFMRLYSYFINVKKSSLVEASDIEMTEELFEKLLSSVENKDDKQTE